MEYPANEPIGNSPTDTLLETIMASFAQHDNDVRSERTNNGLKARFLSGLYIWVVMLLWDTRLSMGMH